MLPDKNAVPIFFQALAQPIGGGQDFSAALWVLRFTKAVVIPQAPLRNGNWVILRSNFTLIVEHGDPVCITDPRIVRLAEEIHVIRTQCVRVNAPGHRWLVVPEAKLALSRLEIRGENPLVILKLFTSHWVGL